MTRLTFLRRIGRPVAILYPMLCVGLYVDPESARAWGDLLADAVGTFLFVALFYAPLFGAPFFLQRSLPARVVVALLLMPAIAMQLFYVLFGVLTLRFRDGFGVWTFYLVSLALLVVLFTAMVVLLWSPGRPPTSVSPVAPGPSAPEATAITAAVRTTR